MAVHAAMAGDRVGYYSWRERQGMSGGRFPAVRSRTPAAQQDAASPLRICLGWTAIEGPAEARTLRTRGKVRLPPSPLRGHGGRESRTLRTDRKAGREPALGSWELAVGSLTIQIGRASCRERVEICE